MSLLGKALDLLGDQVDDQADDWFEKLLDGLGGLIADTSDNDLKVGGEKAFQILSENQDKFIGLGKKSFIMFVGHVAAGKHDEAAKEYYRNKASAREIIDAILDDALDINKLRKQREELKKEALELAKLLLNGARYLLPLLLML